MTNATTLHYTTLGKGTKVPKWYQGTKGINHSIGGVVR